MTLAEAFAARFEELERTNPPDLSKHWDDLQRQVSRREYLEDSQTTRKTPGQIVEILTLHDGSRLRVTLQRKYRESSHRWVSATVEPGSV